MAFDNSIFINCPFDAAYKKLLHPLIFLCSYCGFEVKLSELRDSGSTRIRGIIRLMKASRYSIHDLSRMKSEKPNELSRFNMPFELGLDLGLREGEVEELKSKVCLVIDEEKFRYQAAISDLGGSDIASYGVKNQIENIIEIVRHWFTVVKSPIQPSANLLYSEYLEFTSDLQLKLEALKFGKNPIPNLTNSEYIHYVNEWVSARP